MKKFHLNKFLRTLSVGLLTHVIWRQAEGRANFSKKVHVNGGISGFLGGQGCVVVEGAQCRVQATVARTVLLVYPGAFLVETTSL